MLLFGKEQIESSCLDKIPKWTLAFRGFKAEKELPRWHKSKKRLKRKDMLCIPNEQPTKRKIRIALGCLETKDKSWKAAACADPEPDTTRYIRLNRLVNSVISSSKHPDYLVLPELSVPARWFSRIAIKLAQNKISLLAGVDYIHHGKKRVANQAWASLISDFVGFPLSVIYRQDKFNLAQHEECNLWRVAGVRSQPLSKDNRKPVIIHGNFHFAILICSELTNIRYRAKFRGNVDAVLVPEWNKDAKSFAALVESSALDIHAYIVQCNDRKYGDSRIRAPFKDNWRRDVVRVKGGIEDFIVIGEIDFVALRLFQKDHRSPPEGPFKPVPDGFKLSASRKLSPGTGKGSGDGNKS